MHIEAGVALDKELGIVGDLHGAQPFNPSVRAAGEHEGGVIGREVWILKDYIPPYAVVADLVKCLVARVRALAVPFAELKMGET